MATYTASFTTPGTSANVTLQLEVTVTSQDVALNESEVSWTLRAVKGTAGYPSRNYHDCVAAVSVNGSVYSASNLDYSFPSGAYTLTIASGSKSITHTESGTKTITVSASYDGKSPLGTASLSNSMVLPTIERNLAQVGVDDAWVECLVYTGINGSWVAARPYAGDAGEWKALS